MQIISALRRAGHKVTFSMPLNNFIGRKNKARVLPQLSQEEIWACEHFGEPEVVLNRIQPEIAIYCNVNTFRTLSRFSNEIVNIVDFNGPMQFEGLFMNAPDMETAMRDGAILEARCLELVQKMRDVDYVMTVSERQKYFWSAYCTLAGFSFSELKLLVCPSTYECAPLSRNPASELTVVYSGGFYPWQDPERFLFAAASILDGIEGAILHVFGEPHAGMPNEADVKRMLQQLQEHRCVKYHGYKPIEDVMAVLSTAWCALELMEYTFERELAVTGRTLGFLASGTPVIYNNYATLSKLIETYNAGWTLSTADTAPLESVFEQLASGGLPLVEKLSCNARRLAVSEFAGNECMRPLLDLCAGPVAKRSRPSAPAVIHPSSDLKPESLGRVLAVTPGAGSLRELRISNPLRALQRQGYISALKIVDPSFHDLRDDQNRYHALVIQRAVPEYIVETLHNLGLSFALDCDDNLLSRPAFRQGPTEGELLSGLRFCTVLTTPNPRLVRNLEKYSGMPLEGKAYITPNALPFPQGVPSRSYSQPEQILWIQSDIAALGDSREAVVRAVDDFSHKYSLPIVLIGPEVLKQPKFKHQVFMGEIDFTSNLQLLEFAASSVGVAPLETVADQETLDFVAGKSDLKILLFAGYGHAGVYSAAPPYSDSPLQEGLSVIGNTYEEWTAALEYQHREGWKKLPEITERIQSERHIDTVAKNSWRPALQACHLAKPVRGADLYEAFHATRQVDPAPVRSMAYMLANWDVAREYVACGYGTAWDHYSTYGRGEQRLARHAPEVHSRFLEKIASDTGEYMKSIKEAIRKRELTIKTLRENEKERNRSQDEVRRLQGCVDKLERDLSIAHRTLEGMANSRSWKLTAPLRKATGLLKKR